MVKIPINSMHGFYVFETTIDLFGVYLISRVFINQSLIKKISPKCLKASKEG